MRHDSYTRTADWLAYLCVIGVRVSGYRTQQTLCLFDLTRAAMQATASGMAKLTILNYVERTFVERGILRWRIAHINHI